MEGKSLRGADAEAVGDVEIGRAPFGMVVEGILR
jgi:hypothetical protein